MSANPISIIILAVVALAAAIIILWQRSETFRDIVLAVWGVISGFIGLHVEVIKTIFNDLSNAVQAVINFFSQVPGWITGALSTVWSVVSAPFVRAWQVVSQTTSSMWGAVLGIVRAIPGQIAGALSSVISVITLPYRTAWSLAQGIVSSGVSSVLGVFRGVSGAISSALSGVTNAITAPFKAAISAVQTIVDTISRIAGSVRGTVDAGLSAARSLYNGFRNVWNGIQITLPSVKIPLGPTIGGGSIGLPDLPALARGGYVTGPTLALIGEGRSSGRSVPEIVAPEPMLRRIIRAETGGNTAPAINITINVPPAANPAEVGRILVEHIRSYENAAGAGWRVATR